MRKLSVFLICLLSLGLVWLDANAQGPTSEIVFFHLRQFKIPFKVEQKNVIEARLFVSSDQGRTWTYAAKAAPAEQLFSFNTPQDGLYWFAVQTVDVQNNLFPRTQNEFRATLRVNVDTIAPNVQVQPLPPRAGEVGVSWLIRDDNLDMGLPDSIRVEYRVANGVNWIPLAVPPGATQLYWNPQTNAQLDVRVLARDRAGNVGEDKTNVILNGGGNVFPPPLNPMGVADGGPGIDRKFVNNKQISLGYDLRDVGPSGVSSVELWYTLQQGRTWNKLTEYPIDLKNPQEARDTKKLTFEVNDEGVYGITLVAKSGVGLGERARQPGDRPQFWIEVDLTKPVVNLSDVKVGTGIDKGKLTILWKADDKNLTATPIRISFAEDKAGQWTPIADKLPNNGRYVWKMPEPLPYQFFVRVEAIDRASNIGEAATAERVKVDLSLPKAKIVDIVPGGQ